MKRSVVCFCESRFEAEIPDEVDLALNPEVEGQIIEGIFQTIRCPDCGKTLKPEFPVHLVDRKGDFDLFFIPELDRGAFFRKALDYSLPEVRRVAIGYEELVEKLLIKRCGLDDRVVEVIKYYLLDKALRESGEQEDREIRIGFQAQEEAALVFHARGLKEQEVAVLKVPLPMAERIRQSLEERCRREPLSRILEGPYVSVNKLYSEAGE